jgi:hypothetical protein
MNDKTIPDKLYLKTVRSLAVLNPGVNPSIVAQLPTEMIKDDEQQADVVLLFALHQADIDTYWDQALARLGDKGSLWIAFLKPSAPKATDIDRDSIDAYAQARGATVVAMISMDLDWSAVRLKRMEVPA